MIFKILFLMLMLGCGGFVASRVYLLITKRSLNVKGITYSRTMTPVLYWVELALAITGAAMILGIAGLWAFGLAFGTR